MAATAQPPILPTSGADTQQPANAPGAAGAPTSYKDPTYAQLDAATSQQLGLPAWLLPAIRTQGEKSNNDQVSSAGAQTVYQITPATRQLAIKQYGIDPYLSASSASLVAGKLLSDSMQRNNGSVPQAVGEYIGGTNRNNWGSTTNAYIKRVLQGAGSAQSATSGGNPYAAASADADQTTTSVGNTVSGLPSSTGSTQAGPSIAKLVDAFNSGAMDQQAATDFQNDVNNGKVFLPQGAKLTRTVLPPQPTQDEGQQIVPITAAQAAAAQAQQTPSQTAPAPAQAAQPVAQQQPAPQAAPQAVPLSVVQAYQSGQMDPQAKAEFESDIKAGKIALPPAQTPQQQGFLQQVGHQLGLFTRDAIQAAGNTVGIGADPIGAVINLTTGSHLQTAGSLATKAANALGLPTPQNATESVVNQATEAGLGGLGFAGAAGLASKVPGAVGAAADTLAANPAAQTIASAAGGGAGEQAKQAGAGPVLQTAANIGAAMVSPSRVGNTLARGAELIGQRVAPGLTAKIASIAADDQQPLRQAAQEVAQTIQSTPKDVAFDPATGEITKEGRELSILSGLTPDGLRKAYGKLETAAQGQVQNDATAQGAAHGIDYTKGQATGDFATQDKEQTLVKSATPEGDQARGFFDQQQQQINQAVDNFRAGFGDTGATASERGAQVQDAARVLRAQGQAGVRAMYEQAASLPGEAIPLETQPVLDAAARTITEMPTEPAVKEALQNTLAKYGVLGGEVTEKGPFGNTVSVGNKSYQISGDMTPLSLSNAESLRQALNRVYAADKTGHTGSVIAALDDSVENAVGQIAQRGANGPEVGAQVSHVANNVSTSATFNGPGAQEGYGNVTIAPTPVTDEARAALVQPLAAERATLAAERARGAAPSELEGALQAATGTGNARAKARALTWAQANDRPDIAQALLTNARGDAEALAAQAAKSPRNETLQNVAKQADFNASKLHEQAGAPYGTSTRDVPMNEIVQSEPTGDAATRQVAFERARATARQQKRTYEAKDVIQDLTDFKNGTMTPKVLPENTFNPLFNNPSNLRKAKATLLGVGPDGTTTNAARRGAGTNEQAWKAIQGQALAQIAEQARNPQSGGYSAARLNSAIAKFGDENLRTLFDAADYNRLKSLQAAISRTQPLSGTVNHSNTFTKFANLIGSHLGDSVAAAGSAVAGVPGMIAGKGLGMIAEKVAQSRKDSTILKSVVNPSAPAARAAQARVDKANDDLIDTLINASKMNAFVPYGVTTSTNSDRNK